MDVPSPETMLKTVTDEDGNTTKDIPLPAKYRDKIEEHAEALALDIHPNHILHILRSKKVINQASYETLLHSFGKDGRKPTVLSLLDLLLTRGREAYFNFCKVLRDDADQEFLYDLLADDDVENAIGESPSEVHKITQETARSVMNASTQCGDFSRLRLEPDCATGEDTAEKNVAGKANDFAAASENATGQETTVHPPPESYSISQNDPQWIQELRKYQLELAYPGTKGQNYIFCAPTGSGKTRVAAYVIYRHLQDHGEKARIVFFAPTVALVNQQSSELKLLFKDCKVDKLTGEEKDDSKDDIENMLKYNQIVCMTPAIYFNGLKYKRLKDFHCSTLLIFDECHHADKDHVYNQLMALYMDEKISIGRGQLPQVVGMTASLGVGNTTSVEGAADYILQKCANLDAHCITVVEDNREELGKFVKIPDEELITVKEKGDDEFSTEVINTMKTIENRIAATQSTALLSMEFDFPLFKSSPSYLNYLKKIVWKIAELPSERQSDRRKIMGCLEYLTCFHKTLIIHKEVRAKDALIVLQDMLETRSSCEDETHGIEKELKDLYQDIWPKLNKISQDLKIKNPKLVVLKGVILKAFKKDEDSQGILFTKTRQATQALTNWVNEDEDLKFLNAVRLTGAKSDEYAGMSMSNQNKTLKYFKLGNSKLLIATSVAEEGLDIAACNVVFRYNYSTSEIGRVQTKGRARRSESQVLTIASEERQDIQSKERISLYREGLMNDAIIKIGKMQIHDYQKHVQFYQWTSYTDRRCKENLEMILNERKSKKPMQVSCYRCDTVLWTSDKIVCFHENTYTCIAKNFKELCQIKRHRKGGEYGRIKKKFKLHCKTCNWDWGLIVTFKERFTLPVIKASGFTFSEIMPDGGLKKVTAPALKRWDDAPCVFKSISESEIEAYFKEGDFELTES